MNLYSLHRNKEHWGDPHTFRPERFIRNGVVFQVKYHRQAIDIEFISNKA